MPCVPNFDSRKDELKQYALRLGFNAVGISRPKPQTWEKFAEWLRHGYHGEMHYLFTHSRERRDISALLDRPGSVIAVAHSYPPHEPNSLRPASSFHPEISVYAQGNDYHEVMKSKLQALRKFIQEQTSGKHDARICVDALPLLERDFAAQAGIGWFGKHTNLLSHTLGNWFFLGAVITTLELEPDVSVQPHCGTCTRCLAACPTQAFIGPYVLDARRCISYLTIELKGPIPREFRPLMGRRIFGCDECLAVCPWNRFSQPTHEPEYSPRSEITDLDLLEWMALTDEEFRRRFRNSPIRRAKRCGMLRNVAVALGNTRNPEAVPMLAQALSDTEPLIRGHAAWALGKLSAREILLKAQGHEKNNYVLQEITEALSTISLPGNHF